jgi:CheY-like chemotaxis protein
VSASPRIYNILVVEDNPGDAHLIQEAFNECGSLCKLTMAENFEQAEEVLSTRSFDLILSDMGVHDGRSEEFIKGIRNNPRLKTIPIIVLSGSMNPRPAYEAGANAFVSKTMDMDSFFGKIKALMHFWVDVAELPPARERLARQ